MFFPLQLNHQCRLSLSTSRTVLSVLQRETFINYGGRARKSELDGANDGEVDELVVVTILVAYEGNLKLTKCRDREETKEALERLGAAVADQLLAMEILWTPSDPNDAYTRDNIIEDYPQLNTL